MARIGDSNIGEDGTDNQSLLDDAEDAGATDDSTESFEPSSDPLSREDVQQARGTSDGTQTDTQTSPTPQGTEPDPENGPTPDDEVAEGDTTLKERAESVDTDGEIDPSDIQEPEEGQIGTIGATTVTEEEQAVQNADRTVDTPFGDLTDERQRDIQQDFGGQRVAFAPTGQGGTAVFVGEGAGQEAEATIGRLTYLITRALIG